MAKLRLDGIIGLDILASDVADKLSGDMEIVINSPGGSILEGFSIYNAMKNHDGKLNIVVDWAGSMASVIAMAGHEISMRDKSSLMMIHRPWSGAIGRSDDLRSVADSLDKLETMLVGIYMQRGNMSEKELRAMLDAETYLTAKEAKQAGFADKIIKSDGAGTKMAMGNGVSIDIMKLVAKLEKESIRDRITESASLSEIEGVLSDSGRLSNADATALVSRIKAIAHGEREQNAETSKLLARISALTRSL